MDVLITTLYVVAVAMFWLLVFRSLAALFKLNPYNPSVQFLYRITEPLVRPFRRARRREARVDPAVIPPLIILFLIITFIMFRHWWAP